LAIVAYNKIRSYPVNLESFLEKIDISGVVFG